jgi:hypothetical protein
MSLRQSFIESIDNTIQNFANLVSEKYGLDKNEVYSLWDSETKSNSNVESKKRTIDSVDMDDLSPERLYKANKTELSALCKSRALKSTGKKEELIERLLEITRKKMNSDPKQTKIDFKVENKVESNKTESKKESKSESKSESSSKLSSRDFRTSKKNENVPVIQKVTNEAENLKIRRSAHNNYVHPPSKLVFDPKTKNVVGKEEDDGTVSELNDEDIENCKKYKFSYNLPTNLDKATTLDNVKIDELDELLKEDKSNEDDDDIEEVEDDDEDEIVELEDDE